MSPFCLQRCGRARTLLRNLNALPPSLDLSANDASTQTAPIVPPRKSSLKRDGEAAGKALLMAVVIAGCAIYKIANKTFLF